MQVLVYQFQSSRNIIYNYTNIYSEKNWLRCRIHLILGHAHICIVRFNCNTRRATLVNCRRIFLYLIYFNVRVYWCAAFPSFFHDHKMDLSSNRMRLYACVYTQYVRICIYNIWTRTGRYAIIYILILLRSICMEVCMYVFNYIFTHYFYWSWSWQKLRDGGDEICARVRSVEVNYK